MAVGPPNLRCVFRICYEDGSNKQVVVYDWNRGGAWATLCRDLNKKDHGDTKTVVSVSLRSMGAV